MFARSQAMRKPGSIMSAGDAQDEMLLKQSIGEIMGNESWETKTDMDGTLITLGETLDNSRNFGTSQSMKLLMASPDDSNKKFLRGGSSSQTRERRKVQMVEQPGQKAAGRSPQVARTAPVTQARPLSADDIQKAKMRAQFMQNKYGKSLTSPSSESPQLKIEGPSPCSSSQASILLSATKALVRPKVEEQKKPMKIVPNMVSNQPKNTLQNKVSSDPEEPLWKKCKRFRIPWLTPPEMEINSAWSVGMGENSKEVEFQKNRIRREKEIVYKTLQEIPSNPKEPWDLEMDYDDTLTPEIPVDQLPDSDGMETDVSPRENPELAVSKVLTSGTLQNSNGNMPEPDLELLAVLLKNPEVVFALTSGQGGNLSSEQMVKLLDMIKSNGVNSVGSLITGLVDKKAEEKVEVSLPSPTPSSNPVPSGWRPDIAKNPFSRGNVTVNGEAYTIPGVSLQEKLPTSRLVHPQIPVNSVMVPQSSPTVPSLTDQPTHLPGASMASSNGQLQLRTSDAVPSMSSSSWPSSLAGPVLPTPAHHRTQPHPTIISEPTHLSAHSWRARQGTALNTYPQANQNNYNAYGGGHMQAPMQQPGPSWERNEYIREAGFDYGSGNSPTRYQENMLGWNYSEPRMNLGHNYRPEMARPRNTSGYRDHGRNVNLRWHDRRR